MNSHIHMHTPYVSNNSSLFMHMHVSCKPDLYARAHTTNMTNLCTHTYNMTHVCTHTYNTHIIILCQPGARAIAIFLSPPVFSFPPFHPQSLSLCPSSPSINPSSSLSPSITPSFSFSFSPWFSLCGRLAVAFSKRGAGEGQGQDRCSPS